MSSKLIFYLKKKHAYIIPTFAVRTPYDMYLAKLVLTEKGTKSASNIGYFEAKKRPLPARQIIVLPTNKPNLYNFLNHDRIPNWLLCI